MPTTDASLRNKAPVMVAAHRGVVDEAHPENTVESAVNTMNCGIEAMELDVYESSDYVPYLTHDKNLLRMLNRREYSDIYRWQKEGGGDITSKTPPWSDIKSTFVCDNRADGYGMTEDHLNCNSLGIYPTSLDDALHELYEDSYTGMVLLDLRQSENTRDTAARLLRVLNTEIGYGSWIVEHVVLKFQTTMFNGLDDYAKQVMDKYLSLYGDNANTSRFNRAGEGCTDHRPFREWWHDTAKFGFVITDKPVETIQYLDQFPGQRPSSQGIDGVNFFALPPLVVAADVYLTGSDGWQPSKVLYGSTTRQALPFRAGRGRTERAHDLVHHRRQPQCAGVLGRAAS